MAKKSSPNWQRLKADGVKGLGPTNLKLCRIFFEQYPEIRQTLSGEFIWIFNINDLQKKIVS
jgi:hypothetical protein